MGESFGDLQDRFLLQKSKLVTRGLEIVVVWECEWKIFLEEVNVRDSTDTSLFRSLLEKDILTRPKERLIPREALRGGRVDAINLFWSKSCNPSHRLEYLDYNSL